MSEASRARSVLAAAHLATLAAEVSPPAMVPPVLALSHHLASKVPLAPKVLPQW
jgi:hypothetical protein